MYFNYSQYVPVQDVLDVLHDLLHMHGSMTNISTMVMNGTIIPMTSCLSF